ncbi:glycosyltransferase [Pseudarthrobacter oxydans]|uniref:glycosyltransferase n=1 Tax=Pseudarthrobacter oxydans TaxID=1671 RepID=UPI003D267E52
MILAITAALRGYVDKHQIHVLEVGGRGGVFQHSLATCIALTDRGHEVTLHTASDPEIEDKRVRLCRCFSWRRKTKIFRGPFIALGFIFLTIPHLLRNSGIFWIQGTFKPPLTMFAIAMLRLMRRRTIFSPHNLFLRYGSRLQAAFMTRCLRLANLVVSYNDNDAQELQAAGIRQSRIPLFMYYPVIAPKTVDYWRKKLRNVGAGVCAVGQLRTDKNLPMLIQAAALAETPLIVMGEDAGSLTEVKDTISRLPQARVAVFEGFYPLEDLAAVIALTGAVALPYSVASQSGVAVLAKAYGAKVIAYGIGGLKEQTDITVGSLAAEDWQKVLKEHAVYDANRVVEITRMSSASEVDSLTKLIGEMCS